MVAGNKVVSDLAARLERVFIGRIGGAAGEGAAYGGGAVYGGGRGRPVEPAGRGRGGGGAAAAAPRPAGRFVPLAESATTVASKGTSQSTARRLQKSSVAAGCRPDLDVLQEIAP